MAKEELVEDAPSWGDAKRIAEEQRHYQTMEHALRVLGNANRLRLLQLLRVPRYTADLALPPARSDEWGLEARSITRQALARHLEELVSIGVVTRLEDGRGVRHVVNHSRLFYFIEELREMTAVQPSMLVEHPTIALNHAAALAPYHGPHLVVVRGALEGRMFDLQGRVGSRWKIGRRRDNTVCLDYDPYVSSVHAVLERTAGDLIIHEAPDSTNGTFLNWSPLPPGGSAPLRHGDVLSVGKSILLYRERTPTSLAERKPSDSTPVDVAMAARPVASEHLPRR